MAIQFLRNISKFQQNFLLQGSRGFWTPQFTCLSTQQNDSNSDASSDTDAPSTDGKGESKEKVNNIRNEILMASLPFVNQHGWTKNAISAGAETLGYQGVAHGMFPKGGIELIQYFYVRCNQKLVDQMKLEIEQTTDATKKTAATIFIRDALETRLRMIIPYIEKWPQAVAIMSLPPNVPTSLANLLTLVDDICYYAGDRSVDFNWYSRRIGVAGIYKTTEFSLLQDKSPDYEATWQFLARRMEDVEQINKYLSQSEEVSQVAKEAITSAFITARNILGLTLGNR